MPFVAVKKEHYEDLPLPEYPKEKKAKGSKLKKQKVTEKVVVPKAAVIPSVSPSK